MLIPLQPANRLMDDVKVLAIFTVLSYLCYRYMKFILFQRDANEKLKKLHGPRIYPLIGNAHVFMGNKNFVEVMEKIMNDFKAAKQPVKIWMGPKLFLLCRCPDDIKAVLTSPHALDKHDVYKFFHPVVGNGLISAPLQVWSKHRKIISPMFNTRILKSYVPKFRRVGEELVQILEKLAGNGKFDAYDIVAPCNVDFLSETALGVRIDAQKSGQTIQCVRAALEAMEIINNRMYKLWLHPPFLYNLSGWEKKQWDHVNVAIGLRKKVLEEKAKEETKGFEDNDIDEDISEAPVPSVLNRLIKQIDIDDTWSMKDVIEELDTIFLTGTDTSATNVCFTLMMLGMYPDVQNKAVLEIKQIFGNTRRPIEVEDLKKLNYLDQIIKETLRIFPVAPFISRNIMQDIELSSCTIPAGSGVVISIRGVQNDPDIWGEDVHKFNPERFAPEKCAGRHPYAYIPFSAGPRNCIGMRYSNLATKYILATILRNFAITCDGKLEDIRVKVGVALSIIGSYDISVERRIPTI